MLGIDRALGRGRPHGVGRHRGLGRVRAAALAAQSRASARRAFPRALVRAALGRRRVVGAVAGWGMRASGAGARSRRRPACSCSARTASSIFAMTIALRSSRGATRSSLASESPPIGDRSADAGANAGVLFSHGRSRLRSRQDSASSRVARRVSVARRGRDRAVRRQGETTALARAQLRHGRSSRERQDARADAVGRRARDDRRAERSARADPRSEPHQGVPPEVQHRAARRQVVSVHQGHGRRAVSARVGHAASRRRRQPLLRAVHRRRRDAARAERREAHLHGALVQLRHAEADARAAVPRLLHQALQGAVHPRADAGRVSRDDRRGARLPRRERTQEVVRRVRERMELAAESLDFERAAELRDALRISSRWKSRRSS